LIRRLCACTPSIIAITRGAISPVYHDNLSTNYRERLQKYLAAYVYRTAFSAQRILSDDGQRITFNYRHRQSGTLRTVRLPAECFLHRFLQHVLPQGFQRLRYFGWLSAAAKTKWQRILALLNWKQPALSPPTPLPPPLCPRCHKPMQWVASLLPRPPP